MPIPETASVSSDQVHVSQSCDKVCRVQNVVIHMINRIIRKFDEDIGYMDVVNDYLSFRELAYDVFVELFRVLPDQLPLFGQEKIMFSILTSPPNRKTHPSAHIASLLIHGYYEASRGDEQIRQTIQFVSGLPEDDNKNILPITLSEFVDKQYTEATIGYVYAPLSWHISLSAVIRVVEQQLKRFYGILCENHLSEIAHIDQLTGLKNRRSLDKDFRGLLRANDHFSVGIIDIDHFKNVNDTYGHEVGDEVLRFLGKSLSDFFAKVPHAAVGRFGGEEFLVIIFGMSKGELEDQLNKFREYIAAEYDTWKKGENYPAIITISGGTSDTKDMVMQGKSTTTNDRQKELIQKADTALYGAKNAGRNQILSWNVAAHDELLKEKAGVYIEGNRALRDNK